MKLMVIQWGFMWINGNESTNLCKMRFDYEKLWIEGGFTATTGKLTYKNWEMAINVNAA